MGQDPEKIDLSRFESWDLFQNDQHKLQFTLDIAVSVRNCAVSVKLVKHAQIGFFDKFQNF